MNASKAAGTRWETAVVGYLRAWWPTIDRRPLSGRYDKGDIKYGPKNWTVECKNEERIRLPHYLRQARVEAANNGDSWFVAVVRNRRGKMSTGAVEDAFAVMPLRLWAELVAEHERLKDWHDTELLPLAQSLLDRQLGGRPPGRFLAVSDLLK